MARRAGLRVEGRSELPRWKELFPADFERYAVIENAENAFSERLEADLTLIHPTYVDEAGHSFGAVSAEYKAAVERVDRETSALFRTVDLAEDLVIATADHGHRDSGGHGGPADDIVYVLTCMAGRTVRPRPTPWESPRLREELAPLDAPAVGPAVALLMGLPFPRHMRAGEELDAVWSLLGPPLDAAYADDRKAAVARFRTEHERTVSEWTDGRANTWDGLYAHMRRGQWVRGGLDVLVLVALGTLYLRRRAWRLAVPWATAVVGATLALYALLAGGIDATTLNGRPFFLRNTFIASGVAVALGLAALALARRTRKDVPACLDALAGFNGWHILTFGWPLGFPLPHYIILYVAPFYPNVA